MQPSQDTPFNTTRLRPALGTLVAIEALANSPEISDLSVAAGFETIAAVERLMHPTRNGSDLAALRNAPLHAPLSVHAWTFAVLELCKQFHRLSAGVFDPCLPTSPGRLGDLELNAPHDVTAHARLHLDLGGIAKGYAVDRAIEALRGAGCVGGLVNAGGDLATFGEPEREIRCRRSNGHSVVVTLRDAALATSDTEHASPPAEHQGYYHGIQRSLRPKGYVAVTAPDAATADALTKCLLADGNSMAMARLLNVCGARRIELADEE